LSREPFNSVAQKMSLNEDMKQLAATLILLNPDLLIAQYSKSNALATDAEELLKNGNSIVAKNRFASAAKLAFYEGDPSSAKRHLEKVVSIDQASAYGTVLSNFNDFSKFVDEFYKKKAGTT
jgi:hypothetical protein